MRSVAKIGLFLLLAVNLACSDAEIRGAASGDGGSDALGDAISEPVAEDVTAVPPRDSGFQSAPHPPFPSIPNHGGAVLASIRLVTVTFAGYPYESDMQSFGDWIVGSEWLKSVGQEYGVASGTHVAKIVVQQTAPAFAGQPDVEAFLNAQISHGILPGPSTSDNDYLYVVYYPATTQLDVVPGAHGCQSSYGWHSAVLSPLRLAYAAIPVCPAPFAGWTQLESIEQNAAHEIIEAATDPDPTRPAYYEDDPASPFYYMGGEVGDLCVGLLAQEAGFTAQRIWSNQSAVAGSSPCVPSPPGDIVFGVAPTSLASVKVPAGGTASVTLTAWSSTPRPAWNIYAYASGIFGFAPSSRLSTSSIDNAGTVTLTLDVPAGAAAGSLGAVIVGSIDQTKASALGDRLYEWPVLIQVP